MSEHEPGWPDAARGCEPALTEKEWTQGEASRGYETLLTKDDDYVGVYCGDERSTLLDSSGRHALAALCLHDQPFGFTREDVELLRDTKCSDVLHLGYAYEEEPEAHLNDLADRIEALLPPGDV